MRTIRALESVGLLENATWLDPVANKLRSVVKSVIRPQPLRDVLHGVPVGHPLHPLLILVPVGTWVSAAVLDVFPRTDGAAKILIGTGIAGAIPSALTGYTDWSETHEQQLRVGVVHSTANLVGVVLYSLSLIERLAGRTGSGKALSFAGLAVVSAGGFLGGHLAYRQAVGANHAEDVPHRITPGWQGIGDLGDMPEGRLFRRTLGDIPLVVFRRGVEVSVLSDVCSHLSGPLHEGELTADDDDPCVVCPWHQSTFSLRTGEVVHGPATSPQSSFLSRVVDGAVEVCLPNAG
ncbi:Rieske 2Fe-2S domain-containing protein [Arthrobacter sp. CG_A4]|uniref:Rieske 2Fe-2S domain-containing protein n=1 Tax=Arthrobacter sp. CG_A4 TaxID=3071706 RepID=UPI002DFDBDDD|nr:nitrite reductase/ring-hydroxylating ferredoxin subunit/uncharacterized membrane protein [Arthrobacter sp. CG_A4]